MKCKVCSSEALEDGFCVFHLKAYKEIIEKFNAWSKALSVSWRQYLIEIQKNSLTGEWAKEVVEYLIEEPDGDKKR